MVSCHNDRIRSNIVTRAVGVDEDLKLDTLTFEATPGDTYLLCSDGLDKEVNPMEIIDILSRSDPDECSRVLIDCAVSQGARDNVTVVVVTVDPDTEVNS